MTTKTMPCKFCKDTAIGGIFYHDLANNSVRACWKPACKKQYDQDQLAIKFQNRTKRRLTGKCWYVDIDGICQEKTALGEALCVGHLMRRCVVCGLQATHTCLWSGLQHCEAALCDDHNHNHKNDYTYTFG